MSSYSNTAVSARSEGIWQKNEYPESSFAICKSGNTTGHRRMVYCCFRKYFIGRTLVSQVGKTLISGLQCIKRCQIQVGSVVSKFWKRGGGGGGLHILWWQVSSVLVTLVPDLWQLLNKYFLNKWINKWTNIWAAEFFTAVAYEFMLKSFFWVFVV